MKKELDESSILDQNRLRKIFEEGLDKINIMSVSVDFSFNINWSPSFFEKGIGSFS